jgi:hypothetical protein
MSVVISADFADTNKKALPFSLDALKRMQKGQKL